MDIINAIDWCRGRCRRRAGAGCASENLNCQNRIQAPESRIQNGTNACREFERPSEAQTSEQIFAIIREIGVKPPSVNAECGINRLRLRHSSFFILPSKSVSLPSTSLRDPEAFSGRESDDNAGKEPS